MKMTSNKDVADIQKSIMNMEVDGRINFAKSYRELHETIMFGILNNTIYKHKHLGLSIVVYFNENETGPEKIYHIFRNRLLVFLPYESEFKEVDNDIYELKEVYLIDSDTFNKMKLLGLNKLSDTNINKMFHDKKLMELIKIKEGKLYLNGKYHADL